MSKDALIRLKIFTPLAVLLALAANLVVALAIHPSSAMMSTTSTSGLATDLPTVGQINDDYLTLVTPKKHLVGIYWLVVVRLSSQSCRRSSLSTHTGGNTVRPAHRVCGARHHRPEGGNEADHRQRCRSTLPVST